MANKLDVEWRLVNLTSNQLVNQLSEDELAAFTNAVLPASMQRRFVKYTWEQLFRDHVEGKGDLQELDTYMQFKSANCRKAFDI
jgi:predicted 2-oxoglutarate/Fe(II)-dependent dioxygenase YbiX